MPLDRFDDECQDCKPALVDVRTGKRYDDSSPAMQAILRLWGTLTLAERQAWHRFTCKNSRSLVDVQIVKDFSERIERAFTEKS